jgi:REP element-mobilizing transposase RayT
MPKFAPMRQVRIKIPASEASAVYHCISRTVNGEHLFDDTAKEIFRKQLWQVAEFCGIQIITHTVLSNHFHVLLRTPQRTEISDVELLRRYSILYPRPTAYQLARLDFIRVELAKHGPEAVTWRHRQLALMGDVSQFMKLLKQRFSIWFNKNHRRFGTLWAERFKSVLIESQSHLLEAVAAYIDLNSVRAGLVNDPKDYRFCGYAEAVADNSAAQLGISSVTSCPTWAETQARYRETLFGIGAAPRNKAASIKPDDLQRVLRARGHLSLATLLRCRLRYLSEGAVLGTRAFVTVQLEALRRKTGRSSPTVPYSLSGPDDSNEITALRKLRLRIADHHV